MDVWARTNPWWKILLAYHRRRCRSWNSTSQSFGKKPAGPGITPTDNPEEIPHEVQHGPFVFYFFSGMSVFPFLLRAAGTRAIWSKRFTTTPSPGNGDACGAKMMRSDRWRSSSEFWRWENCEPFTFEHHLSLKCDSSEGVLSCYTMPYNNAGSESGEVKMLSSHSLSWGFSLVWHAFWVAGSCSSRT